MSFETKRKRVILNMSNTVRSVIELSLLEFKVRYRKLGDDLYFCILPNDLTFDLMYGDSTIRMWRFVDSVPLIKAGTCFFYGKANATLGVEITDEGDVELFAEYRYDRKAPDIEQRIRKMLTGYIDMIMHYKSERQTVG